MSSTASIAALSTSQSQAQLSQAVNIKVAKKTLDAARAQGDAAVSLLQQAAQMQQQMISEPGKGARIDVTG